MVISGCLRSEQAPRVQYLGPGWFQDNESNGLRGASSMVNWAVPKEGSSCLQELWLSICAESSWQIFRTEVILLIVCPVQWNGGNNSQFLFIKSQNVPDVSLILSALVILSQGMGRGRVNGQMALNSITQEFIISQLWIVAQESCDSWQEAHSI